MEERIFVLPARVVDEIILETTKARAILNVHVAGLEGVAQQTIDQKLVSIDIQDVLLANAVAAEQISSEPARNKGNGERLRVGLSRGFALVQQPLQKRDGLE